MNNTYTYDRIERISSRTPMTIEEVLLEYAGEIEAGNKVDVQLLCGGRKALVKIAYRASVEEAKEAVASTIEAVTSTTVCENTVSEIVNIVKKVDDENLHWVTICWKTDWYDQRKTYGQNFDRHCHMTRITNTKELVEYLAKIAEFNSAMPNDIYEMSFYWGNKQLFQWKK